MQESRKDEAREYKSKNITTKMNRAKNDTGVSQKSVNSLRSGIISSSSIDSFNLDGHYEGLLKFLLFARVNDNIGYLLTENNLISLPSASLQMSRTLFGSRDKLNAAAPIHHSVDDIHKVSVKAAHRVISFLQITDDEITAEGFSLNGLRKCGGKSESFLGLKNQFRKFLGLPAYRPQLPLDEKLFRVDSSTIPATCSMLGLILPDCSLRSIKFWQGFYLRHTSYNSSFSS
jgi:hypothetical protein